MHNSLRDEAAFIDTRKLADISLESEGVRILMH